MYRCIRLKQPITHRLLNGTTVKYNSLIITNENGYFEVRLSKNGGLASYNEIVITSKDVSQLTPEGYIAIRPNMYSVESVVPALVEQGVLEKHPQQKTIRRGFVEYALFSLNIGVPFIKKAPAPHEIAFGKAYLRKEVI